MRSGKGTTYVGLAVVAGAFLLVIAAVTGIGILSLEVLTSVRAYVGGEGLWSKAEKDAAAALTRYIADGDEASWAEFRKQLAVPLGDRRAREELDREGGDRAAAREGFLAGRNHPADVDGMIWLFRTFRRVEPLDRAIGIWRRGDDLIAELAALGDRVHAAERTATPEDRRDARRRVELLDARATVLEDEFSATLGEAARTVRGMVQTALLAMTGVLVVLALAAVVRVGRTLAARERALVLAEERSQFQATHDALTGLPNRVLFYDRLERAIRHAERVRERFAVVFLDLDSFKDVNDGLGHATGDDVLVGVAGRLTSCLRAEDTVARLGGDEFVFLVHGISKEIDVSALVGKILACVAEPLPAGGRELRLTASLGVAMFPADGGGPDTLVAAADGAMYRAKAGGRSGFRFAGVTPEAARS